MAAKRGGERGSSGAEDGGRWGGWGWTALRLLARKWKLRLQNNHQNPVQRQRFGRGFTARKSSRGWKPRLLTLTVVSCWHTGVEGAPLQPPANQSTLSPWKKNTFFNLIFGLAHTYVGIFLCLDFLLFPMHFSPFPTHLNRFFSVWRHLSAQQQQVDGRLNRNGAGFRLSSLPLHRGVRWHKHSQRRLF